MNPLGPCPRVPYRAHPKMVRHGRWAACGGSAVSWRSIGRAWASAPTLAPSNHVNEAKTTGVVSSSRRVRRLGTSAPAGGRNYGHGKVRR